MLDVSLLFWSAVLVLAVALQVMVTGRALGESGRVQRALLKSARLRAQKQITVVVELRRRAETIFNLLDHLAAHHYKRLDVVIVVHQTAGKKAKRTLEGYRKTSELPSLRLVTHKKGVTLETAVLQYAKGSVLMKLDPEMLLSDRFFERVSYGLMAAKSALLVRRYRRPEQTLMSGWQSLSSLWRAVFMPFSLARHPVIPGTLVSGVPVRKAVIKKGADYVPEPMLFDRFGLDMTAVPVKNQPYPWQVRVVLGVILLVLAALTGLLILTTDRDMLAFVLWLSFAVYIISSLLLLSPYKGLGRLERFLTFLLIPFYPLYLVYRAVFRILEADEAPKRSRLPGRPVRPATR